MKCVSIARATTLFLWYSKTHAGAQGALLAWLVETLCVARALEVGVFTGYSALATALACALPGSAGRCCLTLPVAEPHISPSRNPVHVCTPDTGCVWKGMFPCPQTHACAMTAFIFTCVIVCRCFMSAGAAGEWTPGGVRPRRQLACHCAAGLGRGWCRPQGALMYIGSIPLTRCQAESLCRTS